MSDRKRKVWVLDTGTKGTGAEMVPLEKVLRKPGPGQEPAVVSGKRHPAAAREPEPRPARVFKVVDVMTGRVLAEGVGARTALDVLTEARSLVDVRVYVWQPRADKWRLLTVAEQKTLWDLRDAPLSLSPQQ